MFAEIKSFIQELNPAAIIALTADYEAARELYALWLDEAELWRGKCNAQPLSKRARTWCARQVQAAERAHWYAAQVQRIERDPCGAMIAYDLFS